MTDLPNAESEGELAPAPPKGPRRPAAPTVMPRAAVGGARPGGRGSGVAAAAAAGCSSPDPPTPTTSSGTAALFLRPCGTSLYR